MLNEEDLKILNFYCDKKGEIFTSWELMKSIFKRGGNVDNMRIWRRIERMSKWELFSREGKNKYYLNPERVYKIKFRFNRRKKDSDCICVLRNSTWEMFEL